MSNDQALKKVLITGGAGFIGSNLVEYLFNRYPDYKLIVLDALTYAGRLDSIPEGIKSSPRFEFWHGNVCNSELVNALVGKADIVAHLAAESHVARSIFDNKIFFETDVLRMLFRHGDFQRGPTGLLLLRNLRHP